MRAIILKTFAVMALVLATAAGVAAQTWDCGETPGTVTATLSDGTLTVNGAGVMADYEGWDGAPWYNSRTSITRVVIEVGVTYIGQNAFYNCSSLTSLTIGNGVINIGRTAFAGCTGLTSVTIPNSVTYIGDPIGRYVLPRTVNAFSGCTGLTSIDVGNGNPAYSSVNGVLFSKAGDTLLLYPEGRQGAYSIPNNVTTIGSSAFGRCTGLTSVTIPNSVTSIGSYAFNGCSGLTSVTIPNSVTSIEPYAFSGCTGLTSVAIPDNVTSIGMGAFSGCTGLTSVAIPNSVTEIRHETFSGCTGLTSVAIPNSVTSIGSYAFNGCSGLTSVRCLSEIPPNVDRTSFNDVRGCLFVSETGIEAYRSASEWSSFSCIAAWEALPRTWDCGVIPGTVSATLDEEGTLIIGGTGNMADYLGFLGGVDSPWKDFTGFITDVVINDGVTSIGEFAIAHCRNLTSVTIPNSVTSIGSSAFLYCTGLTSVTIPNSVTSIGSSAFLYCTGLTSVTIGNNVTSIGQEAFYGCSGLTSVTIPNNVTSIGRNAFRYCSGLTLVTIPNSVITIGSSAFSGCTDLTSVTIPNSVTSIEDSAFYQCTGLTSVTIPNNVTSIGRNVFSGCSGLTSVTNLGMAPPGIDASAFTNVPLNSVCLYVPQAAISAYSSADVWKNFSCIQTVSGTLNITFNSQGGSAVSTQYALSGYRVIKPADPARSGYVFGGWYKDAACTEPWVYADPITSNLTLYAKWWPIDEALAWDCGAIPGTVTALLLIGDGTLTVFGSGAMASGAPWSDSRNSITRVVIDWGVTSIGSNAFSGCNGLTSVTIPNSVTYIGYYAFNYCSGLTSLTIPNSVTYIEPYAFYGCSSLKNIEVDDSNNRYSSVDGVLFNKNKTTLVQYPRGKQGAYTIPNSVTYIENSPNPRGGAFSGCSGLTSIDVDDGNTAYSSVDGVLFSKVRDTLLVYPGGKQGAYSIPNSVTTIESSAFSGCTGLTSVSIPNSVTYIGTYVFFGCTGLTSVTSLGLVPPTASSDAFSSVSGCLLVSETSIETYRSDGVWRGFSCIQTLEAFPLTWDCGAAPGTVTATLNEGGTLTINGTGAMANYTSSSNAPWYGFRGFITDIVINDGVTSIGNGAFSGCSGLTSVTIPNSVTSIGDGAFSGCSGLTSVTIPDGVTSIGQFAFAGCSGLTSLTIPNSVMSIGYYAFNQCTGLTSVTIGSGVTSIAERTFSECTGLTSVTIPNSVTSIGNSAFSYCTGLTSLTIPNSVTIIGREAFSGCAGLTSITIPNSVTSIGDYAFNGCRGLTSVTIPNSVTSIGNYAFNGCRGLTSVTIPNSVTSIGDYAFTYCTGLTSIVVSIDNAIYSSENGVLFNKDKTTLVQYPRGKQGTTYSIPNSVTTIGQSTFSGCTGLTSVTIPNSVTSIGADAFSGCSGLTSITCLRVIPPNANSYTFRNMPVASACLYVPQAVISTYSSADVWKDFSCIQAIDGALNITFNSQGGSAVNSQYGLSGGNVTKPADPTREGYIFGGWYKETAGVNLWEFDTDVVTSNTTLYAKWRPFAVTGITGVPDSVEVAKTYTLAGTVVPDNATNKTIIWTVANAGITGAGIYGNILLTSAVGVAIIKATITNGTDTGTDYEQFFVITVAEPAVSVLTPDRVIPQTKPTEEATVVAPVSQLTGEFTAGPNPVAKQSGNVNFYRQGKRVAACELRIYDATGNVINKVKISDKALNTQARRQVGTWDLRDAKGRPVSEGTYLIKGVVKTSDGKGEKVSVIIGVR